MATTRFYQNKIKSYFVLLKSTFGFTFFLNNDFLDIFSRKFDKIEFQSIITF